MLHVIGINYCEPVTNNLAKYLVTTEEGVSVNVEKEIITIISDVSGFDPEEITVDSHFFKDLEIDSIKAIEITVTIEKKFKVSVRDEDVPNLITVRQAIELVEKLLNQRPANAAG